MKFDGWLAATSLQFGVTALIGVMLAQWLPLWWAVGTCCAGAILFYVVALVYDAWHDRLSARVRAAELARADQDNRDCQDGWL